MLRKLSFASFILAACGAGNSQSPLCHGNSTPLDGVCVSQQVADYVACVRAQGARLGDDRSRKLSAEAGLAGTHASVATEVSDHLAREYSTSDANMLEIIKTCGTMRGSHDDACVRAGDALVACGFQNDPAWLNECRQAREYQDCLASAGTDCASLAICGIARWCGGAPVASGSATCEQTGACSHECQGDAACNCGCFSAMSHASALATGIQGQCYNLHCAACGKAGGLSCDECFRANCSAVWDRWCKGH